MPLRDERSKLGQGRAGQGRGRTSCPPNSARCRSPAVAPRSAGLSASDRAAVSRPRRGQPADHARAEVLQAADAPETPAAKTVLALANGDPLIVEQPVHRGRVVLVATSADPSWTSMPLCPSFVPLVQEIVAWCVGRAVRAAEPAGGRAAGRLAAPRLPPRRRRACKAPDGRSRRVQLRSAGDDAALNYPDTAQSGIYVARFGAAGQSHARPSPSTWTRRRATSRRSTPRSCKTKSGRAFPSCIRRRGRTLRASGPGSPIRSAQPAARRSALCGAGLLFGNVLGWKWDRSDAMRNEDCWADEKLARTLHRSCHRRYDHTIPNWIERLFGIKTEAGQGTVWGIEYAWGWPPWMTLLFAACRRHLRGGNLSARSAAATPGPIA